MGNIKNALKCFWDDEHGQSTTEYVLLLLVIVIVVKQLKSTMGDRLGGLVNTIFGQAGQMAQGLGDN
jgi:Flp pilus assembly pilin Flp